MKITDRILTNLCLSTLLLFSLFSVFSCSDDDDVKKNLIFMVSVDISLIVTGLLARL